MGTSGVMLIPVTPPTQCVAECATCGFSGQANTAWGPSTKRSPMQYGRPSYFGAYVRTKCTSQNSSRARKRVVAYISCFTHKPITARYLVLPTRPHRDWRRDWLCDGGWTLGMGQSEISIIFSVHYSRTETVNSQAHKFHFGMIMPWLHLCVKPPRMSNVRQMCEIKNFGAL